MPSSKQGGGFTLTFAKRNNDIKDLLALKKSEGEVITEYICSCIRFYEKNYGKIDNKMNMDMVEELLNKRMAEFKNEILNSTIIKDNEIEIEKSDSYLENLSTEMESKINIDDD